MPIRQVVTLVEMVYINPLQIHHSRPQCFTCSQFASQSEGEGTGNKAGQNASECNKMHFNEPRLTNFLHVVTVVMKATSLPPSNEDVPSPQLRLPLSEFPRSTMGDLPMPRFLERWFQMEAMTTNQKEYINSYSVKTKIERYFQLS